MQNTHVQECETLDDLKKQAKMGRLLKQMCFYLIFDFVNIVR